LNPPSPREELLAGSREVAPTLIGTIPFGLVVGVAAIAAGLTPLQGIALSVLSFSGIAQLVAMQLIAVGSPLPITITAATVVSLRLLMYSASLAPHIAHLDGRWRALLSYLMTDQSYASTVRHYSEPGDRRNRHWHFLGSSATLWITWQIAVVVGVVRTRADLAAALLAAVIALAAAGLPYRLSLIVGSVAGIALGMAIEVARSRSR
jgi:predicted branched-subunit amino acid permease